MTPIYFFAVLFAYAVKGVSGFANTLILNTILSFQTNNINITPMALILSLPSNLYLAWRDRTYLNLRLCLTMATFSILGMIPGVFLLKWGNAIWLKVIMGLLITYIGVEAMLRDRLKKNTPMGKVTMLAISLISGVVSSIFGISTLLVACINRSSRSHLESRSNICCVFAADNTFRLILYICTGVMTLESVKYALFLAPCAVVGLLFGARLADKIGEKRARKATSLLLILSGLSVVITNILLLI